VDRALVEAAQRGERDAFAQLLRIVGDRLYALAYRILRDPHLAQDAFQEGALAAWRQLPTLRDADRFEPWIHRIVVRACYAESRRRSRWSATVRPLDLDDPATPTADLPLIEERDALDRAFARLSVDHRAIFVLHHHLGMSLVEIADLLHIPAGTARSRLHYATQTLRRALADEATGTAMKERLA
jgi:RNA polymerase sigma-70 factor, ECF subfamily